MPSEIALLMADPRYEYDVRGLIGAFYPGVPVRKNPETPDAGALRLTVDAQPSCWQLRAEEAERITEECPAVPEDSSKEKNALKKGLYRLLVRHTGRTLPWGTLTGIRPAKLASGVLRQGGSREDAEAFLMNEYEVSPQKAALCTSAALAEARLLNGKGYEKGFSLYLGIPFCPTRCLYCSFASNPLAGNEERVEAYLDALIRELRETAGILRDRPLFSVYIGGGTPTSLTASQLDRLLTAVYDTYPAEHIAEFTVEAGRPDSISDDKLRVLAQHRVSRISINPQTMNQRTLDRIGRSHSPEDVVRAFGAAREYGFDNINMDIILGLPGEDAADAAHTLDAISRLHPESVTVHALAVKRASRLREEGGFTHAPGSVIGAQAELVDEFVRREGMYPYYLYRQKNMAGNQENAGYCLPGKDGLYNVLMMEEIHSILALGAGTVTKAVFPGGRIERADNVKDLGQYLSRVGEMIDKKITLFGEQAQI